MGSDQCGLVLADPAGHCHHPDVARHALEEGAGSIRANPPAEAPPLQIVVW